MGTDRGNGNVCLAKLRLDIVHASETFEDIQATYDRLPANIVHLFDAYVYTIEHSTLENEADIGLLCLAALADGPKLLYVLVKMLDDLLPRTAKVNLSEVLRATKGLLTLVDHNFPELCPYHQDFDYYLMDDYNGEIMQRRSQVNKWRTQHAQEVESLELAAPRSD